EDKQRRELVEARNQADGLIYATEKSLKEHGDKIDEATRQGIETALAEVKTAQEGERDAAITAKTEALTQAPMKLDEAIYKQASEQAERGGAASSEEEESEDGAKQDGKVVDADYEEISEDEQEKKSGKGKKKRA